MSPPDGVETLEIDGVKVLVEGAGQQTVVMIHGWPDSLRLWDASVAALKNRYRCVRFSLPGYDLERPARRVSFEEMISMFAKIMDRVSPRHAVILMLHDWGCVFGYQYAARFPERVARIVGVDVGDTFSGDFKASLDGRARRGIAVYQLWLAMAFHLGGFGTRMSRWMARQLRCPVDPSQIAAQQNYPYVMAWSGGFRGAADFRPSCPMLYLYGERKPFMFHSPQWLENLSAQAGSEVQGLATGHWVMVQQPEAFIGHVAKWLDGAGH